MKEHFCPAEQATITYQNKCNWCGESEEGMTQDEIIEMACQVFGGLIKKEERNNFVAFANLVAAKEREACAKVCDELSDKHTWEGCYANECAEAIRARGEQA